MAERAKAAVLGALVADAATTSLHWIYDTNKLKELVEASGKTAAPEFFNPPSCPFYQVDVGLLSPYGSEALALLKCTAETGGVDGSSLTECYYNYFTDKEYKGWVNHTIKELIAKFQAGKKYPETGDEKDYQANCFVKVPVVVARYAGTAELEQKLEEAVRVQQNNDSSVAAGIAAGRILEKVVQGSSISEALQWAQQDEGISADMKEVISKALADAASPYADVVKANGLSCGMPGALTNVFNCVARPQKYVDALRANILAGGDNCSRAVFIGALLAAQDGLDSIPEEWKSSTAGYAEMEASIDQLLKAAA